MAPINYNERLNSPSVATTRCTRLGPLVLTHVVLTWGVGSAQVSRTGQAGGCAAVIVRRQGVVSSG